MERIKRYIVTVSVYLGHNPYDTKALLSDMDIRTICKSWDAANTYIDRSIQRNNIANDQQAGKGVIVCKVERPDFFEGHEVDAYYTDTKENKKWMHQYSIFERSLYDPNHDVLAEEKPYEEMGSLEKSMDDIKHGRVTTWASAEEMFKALGI